MVSPEQIFSTIKDVSIRYIGEKEEHFLGLTEDEIQMLEARYQLIFPKFYRLFLAQMARGPLKIFDCQLYAITGITNAHEVAEELTQKDNFRLPENAFPFSQWQGYQFYFFVNDGKDDPDTFFYMEGSSGEKPEPPAVMKDGSFSEWLIGLSVSNIGLYGRLEQKNVEEGIRQLEALLQK